MKISRISIFKLFAYENLPYFLYLYELIYVFPGGSDSREHTCNAGDLGSILGLESSSEGGHGSPLQYSCLENPHGQWSLVGYSPWGHKEMEMIEGT